MNKEEFKEKLSLYNLKALSKELNIDYYALYGFASGRVKNPNIEMYEKLKEFLK